jgi:hypothetical protein
MLKALAGFSNLTVVNPEHRLMSVKRASPRKGGYGMAHKQTITLNAGEPVTPVGQPIDVALTLAMADIKAQFMDLESGKVDYRAVGHAEAFHRYKDLASHLRTFDINSLVSRQQRLAFWINIYNTSVIHGVIELGLQRSVKEVSAFFDRIVLKISGYDFSLNDMEHGILRGNRRPPYRLRKLFGKKDPRMTLAVKPLDPRIHFALVCGARSCPPIGFYESGRVDQQLQLAAMSFMNSTNVEVFPQDMSISLSRIFKWYRDDFGGSNKALLDYVFRFLDESDKKAFLRDHKDRVRIRFQPYNWELNE